MIYSFLQVFDLTPATSASILLKCIYHLNFDFMFFPY